VHNTLIIQIIGLKTERTCSTSFGDT